MRPAMNSDPSEVVTREMLTSAKGEMHTTVETMINAHRAHVEHQIKLIESKLENAAALLEAAQSKLFESGQDRLANMLNSYWDASSQIADLSERFDKRLDELKCTVANDKQYLQDTMFNVIARVDALRQNMEERQGKHSARQSHVRSQVMALQKDLEQVQSQKVAGGGEGGPMSNLAGELWELRREVENLQFKINEGRGSLAPLAEEGTSTSFAESDVENATMEIYAAYRMEVRHLLTKAEEVATQRNDLAVEALTHLRSKLRETNSFASSASAKSDSPDEKLRNFISLHESEERLLLSRSNSQATEEMSASMSGIGSGCQSPAFGSSIKVGVGVSSTSSFESASPAGAALPWQLPRPLT
mmetsp:Transcript_78581/g.139433  ORF Transcript_78581/g.139433 Transcript_78581/m.139433 type:complete len:360 (+) Transcript_78581:50-1129(+)